MQNPNQQFQKQMQAQREAQLKQGWYAQQQGIKPRDKGTAIKMLLMLFIGGPICLAVCGLIGYTTGLAAAGQQTAYIGAAAGGLAALLAVTVAVIAISNT